MIIIHFKRGVNEEMMWGFKKLFPRNLKKYIKFFITLFDRLFIKSNKKNKK